MIYVVELVRRFVSPYEDKDVNVAVRHWTGAADTAIDCYPHHPVTDSQNSLHSSPSNGVEMISETLLRVSREKETVHLRLSSDLICRNLEIPRKPLPASQAPHQS